MYPFPSWRRVTFIAVLVVIIVIAYAPAVTQGTATIRLAAISAPSVVTHIYIGISSIQLHREALPFSSNNSWAIVSQSYPTIDLLAQSGQAIPAAITSAPIASGRYDAIRISFTNSTLTISGQNKPVAAPTGLEANLTMNVAPNGIGNILLVVAFDYSEFFQSQPSLSFILVQASSS